MINIEKLKGKPYTFSRLIGMDPDAFMIILQQFEQKRRKHLQDKKIRKKRINKPGAGRPFNLTSEGILFMTLMYYRLYISQEFLGYLFNLNQGNVSRNLQTAHILLADIFKIPEKKVKMAEDEILEVIYDVTEQQIQRPGKGQRKYYSGKKKKHTVKHQVVVDKKGKIKAVSGTNVGSTHDKSIYEESPVKYNRDVEKRGDLGYFGSDLHIPHKKPKGKELTKEQKAENRTFGSERVVIEHSFGKMKIFRILADVFRNPLEDHCIIFKNVAGIHNFIYAMN